MGLISSYYINSSSYATATAIFTNVALTTLAPDGFYSMEGIVREQSGGVLQQTEDCNECNSTCSGDLVTVIGGEGTYTYSAYVGDDIGSVRIEVDTFNSACGFEVVNGASTTSVISSKNLGRLANPSSFRHTYIGTPSEFNLFSASYANYDYLGEEWVQDGNATINTASNDNLTNAVYHGGGVMTLPKISITNNVFSVVVQAPVVALQDAPSFTVKIDCVRDLPFFIGSFPTHATSADACNGTSTVKIYAQPVNGIESITDDSVTPGLYDFVFADKYGVSVKPDGFYTYAGGYIEVEDGVIIDIDECGGA